MQKEENSYSWKDSLWFWRRLSILLFLLLFTSLYVPNEQGNLIDPSLSDDQRVPTPTDSGQVQGEVLQQRDRSLVTKVIDGDTIRLESGETVRYIGIDSPEASGKEECFAEASLRRNTKLVFNKIVELERDVSERDRFGRLLRYVYVDDIFVNEVLVREGYALAVTYPPDVKEAELFRQAEREARRAGRGLWSECRNS